ncbi:MAG: NUDIX hydrolase [Bacteroidetes bacterium]|nr:NUDIX hydrolase [Bacteroidota bacterium]MCL5026091.1 NUDIX hydrolase [Chloroflexota bacterium]
MSFITGEMLGEWEERYGRPRVLQWRWPVTPGDVAGVRASQKRGRAHDITMFIFRRGRLALIHKPFHERGVYRAPSGGLEPGETLEAGAAREAWEETGLDIALERYLLRIEACFDAGGDVVRWTTHIFQARAVGGRLEPHDHHEIARARYATIEELQGPIRAALLRTGRRLLTYRAALTDEAVAMLSEPAVGAARG